MIKFALDTMEKKCKLTRANQDAGKVQENTLPSLKFCFWDRMIHGEFAQVSIQNSHEEEKL